MSGDQGSREDHPRYPADWAPVDPSPAGPPPAGSPPSEPPPADPPPAGGPPAGAHTGGERPAFLPPAGHAEPGPPSAWPPPERAPAPGNLWNIAVILAAVLLLISAFLPWAEARIVVDIFGRTLTRDLGTVVGVEADGVVVAIPVLALVAAAMAFWGIIGRDDRISALGAVPGVLSLLVCGLFVLRLGDLKDRLASGSLAVGYQVAVITGWYLAVSMSVLVTGFSLARPLAARLAAARERRNAAGPQAPQDAYGPQPPQQGPQQGWWPQEPQDPQQPAQWPRWPDQGQRPGPDQPPEQPGR